MTQRLVLIAAVMLLTLALAGGAILVGASLLRGPTPAIPFATGTFTPTGSLSEARWGHTATLLPDGRVLVVGGANGHGPFFKGVARTVEAFDAATGTFRTVGSLADPLEGHTATLLPDGRVLVAGGFSITSANGDTPSSAELYDPAKGSFSQIGNLLQKCGAVSANLLADGRVLLLGSDTWASGPPSAELYEP